MMMNYVNSYIRYYGIKYPKVASISYGSTEVDEP